MLSADLIRKCWQSARGRLDPYKTQCQGESPGKEMKFPHSCHLTSIDGHQRKVNMRETHHTVSIDTGLQELWEIFPAITGM